MFQFLESSIYHFQKLINSSLVHNLPMLQISQKPTHNSELTHFQTDMGQTLLYPANTVKVGRPSILAISIISLS